MYYTNSVQMLVDANLWQPTGKLADDYLAFKRLHESLQALYAQHSGRPFSLYDVEHVFWLKGGNPFLLVKASFETAVPPVVLPKPSPSTTLPPELATLPDSYVPPVVSVLPILAQHDAAMTDAARRAGTSIERAFEKAVHAAFTILGFEAKLLGQGQGRVPDGTVLAHDYHYAILWDAKVRQNGYSMGTDDRVIRDYVTVQSREMKRRGSIRNLYYVLISSSFADDYEDAIASLKMETDVNEVILMEAGALVAMVDAKLREPLRVTLGPDGLQRLLSSSRVLTAEMVRNFLN